MGAIAEIFREYGDAYIERFGHSMPYEHFKAIQRIRRCRTIASGVNVYKCKDCKELHLLFRGCGSRNCPNCQQHKGNEWLQKRLEDRLPGHHFMVTFTVPAELRDFFRSAQKEAYDCFFEASSAALRELAKDPKHIGADLPGFFGVFHTWGRQLQYHPHIHYVIPGGGIDKKTKTWKPSRQDFFLPVHALSKLFRGKLRAILKEKDLLRYIDPAVWSKAFVIDSQAVGENPEGSIKYLAPYVFRVAISDSRIVSVEHDRVTFTYKKKGSQRYRRMTLDVFEFIRRFLQHVLPKGFVKVRYYGFMGAGCRMSMQEIATLIELAYGFEVTIDRERLELIVPTAPECSHCGGDLKLVQTILAHELTPG
jgi:hypothetical protein